MRTLVFALLLLSGYSNIALAQSGCDLDFSKVRMPNLNDAQLKFSPQNGMPQRICTGDGKTCIWKDSSGQSCATEKQSDGSTKGGCGDDKVKEALGSPDQDGYYSAEETVQNPGPDEASKHRTFYVNFVKNGPIDIQASNDDNTGRDTRNDFKDAIGGDAGDQTAMLDTTSGSTCTSKYDVNVASTQPGDTPATAAACKIILNGSGSVSRDPNGKFYADVANDTTSPPGSVECRHKAADPHVTTGGAGSLATTTQ